MLTTANQGVQIIEIFFYYFCYRIIQDVHTTEEAHIGGILQLL